MSLLQRVAASSAPLYLIAPADVREAVRLAAWRLLTLHWDHMRKTPDEFGQRDVYARITPAGRRVADLLTEKSLQKAQGPYMHGKYD